MQWNPTQIKVTDEDRVASYGQAYAILITCRCGHTREVFQAHAARRLGAKATMGELREKLRCSKCGAHRPEVAVYRRPRD